MAWRWLVGFRSAPPCGERRLCLRGAGPCLPVSIRAPVRGATNSAGHPGGSRSCFDPRPRAGSDGAIQFRDLIQNRFDPRPRAGSDKQWKGDIMFARGFRSAPPCGERRFRLMCSATAWSFDPRPRAGSDVRPQVVAIGPWLFRSAPPCGERPATAARETDWARFDPRPRAGSDDTVRFLQQFEVFRSAPPCGERRSGCQSQDPASPVSIRAPVRGATLRGQMAAGSEARFDPRPRAGSDGRVGLSIRAVGVSIRAPVRGATYPEASRDNYSNVSIRAPVRGATTVPI